MAKSLKVRVFTSYHTEFEQFVMKSTNGPITNEMADDTLTHLLSILQVQFPNNEFRTVKTGPASYNIIPKIVHIA